MKPLAALVGVVAASATLLAQSAAGHPPAFWRAIAAENYAVPAGADVAALTLELEPLLGSPDPELRDEIAYSTLASWIYQKRVVEPATLRVLTDRLLANLKRGIGETDNDGVLRRSFSALALSIVVARDNAAPFMTADDIRRVEDGALAYLAAERDVRGYDAEKGWMHSAAHTADLLKFLGRSRQLTADDQTRVLDAIAAKQSQASVVFTHGEDERFARAILSIVNRPDFDRARFEAWSQRAKPVPVTDPRPEPAQLRGFQNAKNLFAKLEALLALETPSPSGVWAAEKIRAALKNTF